MHVIPSYKLKFFMLASTFISVISIVTGTVANKTANISFIAEGGLEIPILMLFAHENQPISSKIIALYPNKQKRWKKEI